MTYPPVSAKAPYLWHGGDYNPEQWPESIWAEDFRLMEKAGMTCATVGVFSWVSLQPAEDRFTFEWLDKIMDGLHAHGMHAILATPSAAQPAWMSQAYPDVLHTDPRGKRHPHGRRTNYCPNSPNYRRFSADMARRLAERYKDHPALLLWHVSNEYGGDHEGRCFCEICQGKFREWLQARYGSLDALNQAWWTAFWGHTYTDWSQIVPPMENGENAIHGLNIDYRRFMSESNLACYINERDVLRSITPDVPITTNLMGTFKPLDYRRWAKEMDVISWDCYPQPRADAADIAFAHDLHRGLKDGQPFLLMEQTPSSQNWQPVNALKRPGILRLWSYLAVAHGSDSVMYFQWRRSRGSFEKFHSGVVDHAGREDARVFREVEQTGRELRSLGESIIGAATDAKVGLLFDWENWWAIDDGSGPVREKKYVETIRKHYRAFYRQNIAVDIVFSDSDFSKYDLLVAPMLHMIKPGVAEKIEAFVERGGTFVTTYFSGIVDESDLVFEGGYPGPLRRVTGVWVEEIDALYEGQTNTILMADRSGSYPCDYLADLLHNETATVLATYGSDFYRGMPALTENTFGQGKAYYIASDPNDQFLRDFYGRLLSERGIKALFSAPAGVEVTVRQKGDQKIVFVFNHNVQAARVNPGDLSFRDLLSGETVSGTFEIDAHDVKLLTSL